MLRLYAECLKATGLLIGGPADWSICKLNLGSRSVQWHAHRDKTEYVLLTAALGQWTPENVLIDSADQCASMPKVSGQIGCRAAVQSLQAATIRGPEYRREMCRCSVTCWSGTAISGSQPQGDVRVSGGGMRSALCSHAVGAYLSVRISLYLHPEELLVLPADSQRTAVVC